MAIVKEYFKTRNDGVNLYRIYSDAGMMILQVETGNVYEEAIDVEGAPYTYIEYEGATDDPEDTVPEIPDASAAGKPMTRAELTSKVAELEEALNLILSGVTE
ncbi:MAG: hypothetical protein J6L24_03135 [Oscillospiraceae bacterium]|nr:hypothetical protein [Oscillospiraceae bacterium]